MSECRLSDLGKNFLGFGFLNITHVGKFEMEYMVLSLFYGFFKIPGRSLDLFSFLQSKSLYFFPGFRVPPIFYSFLKTSC